ncbi:hypothetical protein EK21DRAFT_115232 [Setomelanomma holmii]|uniref:Uncharacterized protein n=1 Tax=Setomelanomma holmii TaxID=210430 RepID=A0A9P4H3X2_9PLEO|nr:hypothetical protein EK21DRAFT_115232 [Setomelanomma holmii]
MASAPYPNTSTSYSALASGTRSCETSYAPVITTICATTLTGLASKVTITECDQEVTFSTECGFTLSTPTPVTSVASLISPSPTVKRIFTYWLAPWQSLTAGGQTPSDVDVKICTELESGNYECVRHREVWEVIVVTSTLTTSRAVVIPATLSGPGTLIIETSQSVITDTVETINLSTTLLLETEIETESISKGRVSPSPSGTTTVESTSTLYITKTLHHKPSSSSAIELTSTVFRTSTITQTGATTITRARPRPSL